MPFDSNSDLPKSVRDTLPSAAQDVFRASFNNAQEEGNDESSSMAIAWSAVRNAGYKPPEDDDGKWVKKHAPDDAVPTLVDQRTANYRPAESLNQSCASCANFRPGSLFSGYCTKVAGPIRPDYVSDSYEPMTDMDTRQINDEDSTFFALSAPFSIRKSDDERQIVFGWAYVTEKDGEQIVDHSGETIDINELEEAAYIFTLKFGEGNDLHEGETIAHLVESMVFTPEKMEKMGVASDTFPTGWWTGFYVPDTETFNTIKNSRRMLSIEGVSRKEPVDAE